MTERDRDEGDEPEEADLANAETSRRTDEPRAEAGRAGSRGAARDVGARIADSLDRIAECLERIEGFLARSGGGRREREHGAPEFRPGRRPDDRREPGREYRRDSGYPGGGGGGGGYQDRRGDQYRGPRDRFGGQRDRPGGRRWGRGEGNRRSRPGSEPRRGPS